VGEKMSGSGSAQGHADVKTLYYAVRDSRATYAVLMAGLALQVVLVVLHGVNKELLSDANFLALDKDNNLPSWTTTALFAIAGVTYGLLAWLRPSARIPLAGLGALALLLSLEQTAQIHTRVEEDLGDAATIALQTLAAMGVVGVVAFAARALPALSNALLFAAIAAIALSQGSSLANSEFELPYWGIVLFQTLEEVGEMTTAVLLIAAAVGPGLEAILARVLAEREREGERKPVAV
jgi:hypothetical protein